MESRNVPAAPASQSETENQTTKTANIEEIQLRYNYGG